MTENVEITTVKIPTELHRRLKIEAAIKSKKLIDLIPALIEKGLKAD